MKTRDEQRVRDDPVDEGVPRVKDESEDEGFEDSNSRPSSHDDKVPD